MNLPEEHQDWRKYGRCTSLGTDDADRLFFFGPGGSPVRAKKFCDLCPVKRQCLHYAIYHNEEGVWAGTTFEERQRLKDLIFPRILELRLIEFEIRFGPDVVRASVLQAEVELNPNISADDPLGLGELLEVLDDPIVFREVS